MLDPKTQSTLESLGKAMTAVVQRGGTGTEDDLSGILTPSDECERWKQVAMGYASRTISDEERRRAEEMWTALSPVSEKLSVFATLPLPEMKDRR